ncbi:unnamed protein product [Ectocarpus fasciculatus]
MIYYLCRHIKASRLYAWQYKNLLLKQFFIFKRDCCGLYFSRSSFFVLLRVHLVVSLLATRPELSPSSCRSSFHIFSHTSRGGTMVHETKRQEKKKQAAAGKLKIGQECQSPPSIS